MYLLEKQTNKKYFLLKFFSLHSGSLIPKASWCFLAFNLKSAMLDDLTEIFSSTLLFSPAESLSVMVSALELLLLLLLEFDKLRGKILRGSVKDELEEEVVLEIKLAG